MQACILNVCIYVYCIWCVMCLCTVFVFLLSIIIVHNKTVVIKNIHIIRVQNLIIVFMLSSIQDMVSNYENSYWTFCTIIIMSRGRVHLMSVFKKVFAELNPDRVYIIGKKSNFNKRTSKCTFNLLPLTLLHSYGFMIPRHYSEIDISKISKGIEPRV